MVVRIRYQVVIGALLGLVAGLYLGGIAVRAGDRVAIDWPTSATALKDFLTAVALVVGGSWTYFLLKRRREHVSRAVLSHRHRVWQHEGKKILRVDVEIRNPGQIDIHPGRAWTLVQIPPKGEMRPTESAEDEWKDLAKITHPFIEDEVVIEPNEPETYSHDVPLPPDTRYVQLYTRIDCERKPGATDPIGFYSDPHKAVADRTEAGTADEDDDDELHWSVMTLIDLDDRPSVTVEK